MLPVVFGSNWMQSSAEVLIREDGPVTINGGSPDIGGSRASMCIMAAETLGIPHERITAHVLTRKTRVIAT
ncbi:MAG: hypothetical protein Ct9H300mP8_10740 [Gammaproteobacteria bacterium]|nr:MAG: hypothetical protein Ct9H300mP8_10740 [Gammaproteobacteria bacterium]